MSTEDNQPNRRPTELLRYTAATDIGMRREENQDSYGVIETTSSRFFVVADGMGGVQGGATASKMAVTVVEQYLKEKDQLNAHDICEAISIANKLIFEKGTSDAALNGMGTTFVGLAFVGNRMFVVNVGDSRAYCFRNNRTYRLTEDHTLVMELVRSGTISVEQAGNHPVSHMLTRSLGPTPEIEIDCYLNENGPVAGDTYLLCSDGLYNMVTESEMADIVNNNSIDQATEMLIDLANQRGGSDNITLILIKSEQDFPAEEKVVQAAYIQEEKAKEQDALNPPHEIKEESKEESVADTNILNGQNPEEFDPFFIPELDPALRFKKAEPKEKKDKDKTEDKSAKPEGADQENKDKSENAKTDILGKSQAEEGDALEDKLKQDTEAASKEYMPRRSTHFLVVMGIVAGIFGGALVVILSRVLFMQEQPEQGGPTTAFIPNEERLVDVPHVALQPIQPVVPEVQRDQSIVLSMKPSDSTSSANTNDNSGVLSRQNLERRKQRLLASIEDFSKVVAKFDQPADENLKAMLEAEEAKYSKLKEDIRNVKSEIDTSVRRLTVWHGRKTKIKESDLTNLASEVSVSSDSVRKKKEEFESASWNYLKEAEALRYMPSDTAQRKKVEELITVRNQKIKEMSEAVGKAIDGEIAEVEKMITNYTLQKETLQEDIDHTDYTIQNLQVLLSGDEAAKTQKKQELDNMLLSLKSELNELENVLPEDSAKKEEESSPVKTEEQPVN